MKSGSPAGAITGTTSARYVIVNADDFGLSDGVNRGIVEAIEHGIVTSTSLMVRQAAAGAAGNWARTARNVSVGLHVDLGEWIFREGQWWPLYTVVSSEDEAAVAREVKSQLETFGRLVGREPTHLDSHQHAHRKEPVRSIMLGLAKRLGVPLREATPGLGYCGDFYGQTGEGEPLAGVLKVEGLQRILADLPPGITELGCHPGYGQGLASTYQAERALETEVLCLPQTRSLLDALGIRLCHFAALPGGGKSSKAEA